MIWTPQPPVTQPNPLLAEFPTEALLLETQTRHGTLNCNLWSLRQAIGLKDWTLDQLHEEIGARTDAYMFSLAQKAMEIEKKRYEDQTERNTVKREFEAKVRDRVAECAPTDDPKKSFMKDYSTYVSTHHGWTVITFNSQYGAACRFSIPTEYNPDTKKFILKNSEDPLFTHQPLWEYWFSQAKRVPAAKLKAQALYEFFQGALANLLTTDNSLTN